MTSKCRNSLHFYLSLQFAIKINYSISFFIRRPKENTHQLKVTFFNLQQQSFQFHDAHTAQVRVDKKFFYDFQPRDSFQENSRRGEIRNDFFFDVRGDFERRPVIYSIHLGNCCLFLLTNKSSNEAFIESKRFR